ncbi:hypothetical protein [Falsiroseomonas sp. E2-1-a4]|uniref:hypothetical protein n=1 Tax=Falsiroseomonas sp. E2-1-a4 TaxID=3239299 RepID=UPI003F2B952B
MLISLGGRVPCDGTIEEGSSALEESPATSVSIPVTRGPASPLWPARSTPTARPAAA